MGFYFDSSIIGVTHSAKRLSLQNYLFNYYCNKPIDLVCIVLIEILQVAESNTIKLGSEGRFEETDTLDEENLKAARANFMKFIWNKIKNNVSVNNRPAQ